MCIDSENVMATAEQMQEALQQLQVESTRAQKAEQERSSFQIHYTGSTECDSEVFCHVLHAHTVRDVYVSDPCIFCLAQTIVLFEFRGRFSVESGAEFVCSSTCGNLVPPLWTLLALWYLELDRGV